jgi:hypothetical protein
MRRARQYTTDYRGLLICMYNGRHRFAWARFSSEALALQWFCRMRCGVAIARVPMYLVVYRHGEIHRQHGNASLCKLS